MAKGAANQAKMGELHSLLTKVFLKVLKRYEQGLETREEIEDHLEDELLDEVVDHGMIINPAVLSAVSKFLKDNEIMFDTEELEELGSLERRLQDKKKKRENVVTLDGIPLVSNGTEK